MTRRRESRVVIWLLLNWVFIIPGCIRTVAQLVRFYIHNPEGWVNGIALTTACLIVACSIALVLDVIRSAGDRANVHPTPLRKEPR